MIDPEQFEEFSYDELLAINAHAQHSSNPCGTTRLPQ